MKLGLKEGTKLIAISRKAIEFGFKENSSELKGISGFKSKSGVFVSLYIGDHLRGCVGIVLPIFPLSKAVVDTARAAAFNDSRFHPLIQDEFNHLRIEISVLTPLEPLKNKSPGDVLKEIKIGRDGLMIKYAGFSGLLLPQVAVEHKWGVQEFLEQTCVKAGLAQKDWKEKECDIYKFQAKIFSEQEPMGKVIEKKL